MFNKKIAPVFTREQFFLIYISVYESVITRVRVL